MKDFVSKAKIINKFSYNNKNYYVSTYMNSNNIPCKKVFDDKLNEIEETEEIRESEKNFETLDQNEVTLFKQQIKDKYLSNTYSKVEKFNMNNNTYYSYSFQDEYNQPTRIFYNSNYQEVEPNSEALEALKKNAEELSSVDTKEFIKIIENNYKKELKGLKKEEKTYKKSDIDILQLSKEERLKKLEENNIKENDVYAIQLKQGDAKSIGFFKVYKSEDGELRLKLIQGNKFKTSGYEDQQIFAKYLDNVNAAGLLNKEVFVKKLISTFKNNKGNTSEWNNEEIKIETNNFTKEYEKEQKQNKQSIISLLKKNKNNEPNSIIQTYYVKTIPEEIKKFYTEKKHINLTNEQYTDLLFLRTKKYFEVDPAEDRNLSNFDKNLLKPLFQQYSKTDGSEKELRKAFNEFVFNHQDDEIIKAIGNIYSKTLSTSFKGFKKEHSNYTKKIREENIEAINNNTYPIMNPHEAIDYIFNPITNAAYKGMNQMNLQRYKYQNQIPTSSFVPVDSFYNHRGKMNNVKVKCQIICNGPNDDGNMVYSLVIPCKPTLSERIADKRAAKNDKRIRDLEYKKDIELAKLKRDYGILPTIETDNYQIPEIQKPVALPKDIKLETKDPRTNKNATIEEKIKFDIENYIKCMFTKEPFYPATDWTKKENKKALLNFQKENPELMEKIANDSYKNISEQVNNRNRQNINEHKHENTNEATKKRTQGR